jgi:hypothetical protein
VLPGTRTLVCPKCKGVQQDLQEEIWVKEGAALTEGDSADLRAGINRKMQQATGRTGGKFQALVLFYHEKTHSLADILSTM